MPAALYPGSAGATYAQTRPNPLSQSRTLPPSVHAHKNHPFLSYNKRTKLYRNLQISVTPFKSQTQGAILIPSAATNQKGCPKGSPGQFSLSFFSLCVKFSLCNILPGLICIWSDMYGISAKTLLEGTFVCTQSFLMCAHLI